MAKAAKPAPRRQTGAVQSFSVLSPVLYDGERFEVGDEISLDEATHAQLLAAGAIEGEWGGGEAEVQTTE